MKANHDKESLEQFFRVVAHLTSNHRCLTLSSDKPPYQEGDKDEFASLAWVSPNELGQALTAVDPDWWKA